MRRNLRELIFRIAIVFSLLIITNNSFSANNIVDKSQTLTVAVASNFYLPLTQLIDQSDYWSSQNIKLVSGSSGTLYAQITKGAPFDLYFSADQALPKKLEEKSLGYNRQTYAFGKLVLWSAVQASSAATFIDDTIGVSGKLAIANPKLAPFGMAANAYLSTFNNAQALNNKLVLGANVTQAFQFVDSGNALYGLLAESTLIQAANALGEPKYLQYALIPFDDYPAITQQVIIIRRTKNKMFAEQFIDFVLSSSSQQKLAVLGYKPLKETSI